MIQGKRDVDTVLAMGVMDDVSIIPQPSSGKCIRGFVLVISESASMC